VSFLAPVIGEGLGFLRILRTLRLLHTYQLTAQLRADSPFFHRNEEVIRAVVNLAVFLFIMTGVVYQTQHWRNPAIATYVDALYFTVTALTTTGFGDITLQGSWGENHRDHHHDLRSDFVLTLSASARATSQGAICVPGVRTAAARRRRSSL
jgi:hypothetical protein